TGEPVVIYGDGYQVRGNTYISDCVDATVAAMQALPGETYNVGGGEAVSVWDVLRKLEAIICCRATLTRAPARPGDQRYTCADTTKLYRHLGWAPRVGLDEGLVRQVSWQKEQLDRSQKPAEEDHSLSAFSDYRECVKVSKGATRMKTLTCGKA